MRTVSILSSLALLAVSAPAAAATLTVGTGQTYASPCAAFAAASANDEIDISPGTYHESCGISKPGLTIKGVGGRPVIDVTGMTISNGKAIWTIDADNITIENIEFMGASVSDENGAAFRIEPPTLTNFTVRGCYIHDNEDGILGGPIAVGGTVLLEGNEFSHNGLGPGCTDKGCTHNLYINANVGKLIFQYNWSHHLATDLPEKGHLLKSRAQQSFILYNRITGEDDTDSYEIDIPQAGLAVVVGNLVEKPAMAGNPISLSYAEESAANADHRLFVVNNTFVNDGSGNGPFIKVANGGTLVAHNNLFVGSGTLSSTGALSADNVATMSPGFVDKAGFDYHLTAGSPAIGKGVMPGSADTFSLTPNEEYVQPLSKETRTDSGMTAGALQYPAPMGAGGSTASSSSGGTGGNSGVGGGAGVGGSEGAGGGTSSGGLGGETGSSTSSGSTSSSGGTPSAKAGCSCSTRSEGGEGLSGLLLLAAVALGTRRRKTAA